MSICGTPTTPTLLMILPHVVINVISRRGLINRSGQTFGSLGSTVEIIVKKITTDNSFSTSLAIFFSVTFTYHY